MPTTVRQIESHDENQLGQKKKEVMETFSYHALLTQIVEQVAFLALSRILGKSFLQKSLAFGILDHIFL